MRPVHVALSLLIAAIWGLNFTVIRFGLDEFTPLSFAAFRFVLGALPVLFIPKPAASWKALAGMGVFLFTGQFVFLFFAMQAGLPPGLASVLVQLQGPLTLVLAALFLGERATAAQWVGLAVAMVGVVLIARTVEGSASVFAIAIALLSALSWAAGNLFLREARGSSIFAATVWASLIPPIPLLLAGFATDGVTATLAPMLAPTVRGTLGAALHGRAGDVARLLDLGNLVAHLSRRQGGPGFPAGAVLRARLLGAADRRDRRRPAPDRRGHRAGRRGARHLRLQSAMTFAASSWAGDFSSGTSR